MDGSQLLFLFGGHTYQSHRITIALDKAIQLQAERLGVQPVSLHPFVALIQLLRTHHMANNRERAQLPLQRKTKPARFIDRLYFGSALLKFGRPGQERLLPKTLRRLGVTPANLLDHHIKILMHINPKLDRACAAIKLAAGSLV